MLPMLLAIAPSLVSAAEVIVQKIKGGPDRHKLVFSTLKDFAEGAAKLGNTPTPTDADLNAVIEVVFQQLKNSGTLGSTMPATPALTGQYIVVGTILGPVPK